MSSIQNLVEMSLLFRMRPSEGNVRATRFLLRRRRKDIGQLYFAAALLASRVIFHKKMRMLIRQSLFYSTLAKS